MSTAFQADAFQGNAFQIVATTVVGGHRRRRRPHRIDDRAERQRLAAIAEEEALALLGMT